MDLVQRGLFGSGIYLGVLMSDRHLTIAVGLIALAMAAKALIDGARYVERQFAFAEAPGAERR